MPENKNRVLLGRILGAHGIQGAVRIRSFTDDPTDIASYGALTDRTGNNALIFKILRATEKGVIARIKGISNRDAANALKDRKLYVERAQLPQPQNDEFYHVDLIGLTAQDEQENAIGTVINVANYGAGDILEIKLTDSDATELIPFTPAFVPNVDLTNKTVTVVISQRQDHEQDS